MINVLCVFNTENEKGSAWLMTIPSPLLVKDTIIMHNDLLFKIIDILALSSSYNNTIFAICIVDYYNIDEYNKFHKISINRIKELIYTYKTKEIEIKDIGMRFHTDEYGNLSYIDFNDIKK